MIRILEELILDEGTNATAKCTAIRTLRELQGDERGETVYSDKFANLDEWRRLRDVKPRRGGRRAPSAVTLPGTAGRLSARNVRTTVCGRVSRPGATHRPSVSATASWAWSPAWRAREVGTLVVAYHGQSNHGARRHPGGAWPQAAVGALRAAILP